MGVNTRQREYKTIEVPSSWFIDSTVLIIFFGGVCTKTYAFLYMKAFHVAPELLCGCQ